MHYLRAIWAGVVVMGSVVLIITGGQANVCSGQTSPTQPDNSGAQAIKDDRYRIGYQDVLSVQVFKHPELGGRAAVDHKGNISLFKLDRPISAVCKTAEELAAEIRRAYMEDYLRNPEVQVSVAEQRSQYIGVIGAVERPGTVYIGRRVHLLDVLAQVGGPSKEAGTRLIVFRGGSPASCRETGDTSDSDVSLIDLKIRDIQQGKQVFWMKPGDVVSVLDADIVYVYGNVVRQGAYQIREPITLQQAIVKAEGLRPTAKKDKVRILRSKDDSGEREEIIIDLERVEKGRANDPYLMPNDIIAVSEDRTKAILKNIGDTLKSTIPGAIYRIP